MQQQTVRRDLCCFNALCYACDAHLVRTYLETHFGDVLGNPSLLDSITYDEMVKFFEKLERDGVGDGKVLKFVTGEDPASL